VAAKVETNFGLISVGAAVVLAFCCATVIHGFVDSDVHAVDLQQVSDGPNCVYCVFGGGYMQSLIHHKYTKEKGRKELDRICEVTLLDVRHECHNLTSQYFSTLWDKITSGIDNVTACNQIHCTGAPETHLIKSPAIKNSKVGQNSEWKQERNINSDLDQCLLCKAMSTAVNMVYYYLNGSEKSFPPEVEYFCIALEEPYIVQCGNMALAYSKEMWHFIRNQGLVRLLCTCMCVCIYMHVYINMNIAC
jgi:hypothetical protein